MKMKIVQPNVDHLDRRQPTEVEVNSEEDINALARRDSKAWQCRVCLNPGGQCICGMKKGIEP
jgi:hypothetical protein